LLIQNLKHKLWPKEGPRVKLPIWLPTRKSQESTQFICLQMTCNIPLESSQRKLQLCFRPHLNRRSACKVMRAPKSRESQLARVRDSHLGVPGEKSHLDVSFVASHKVYYKGEGGGFPQVRAVVSLVCRVAHGSA